MLRGRKAIMNEFMLVVIRIARFLCIAAVILLVAVAAGLMLAPELVWQIVRYALIVICIAAAVGFLVSWLRSGKR